MVEKPGNSGMANVPTVTSTGPCDNQRTLRRRAVHQRTERGLRDDRGNPADCHHEADRRLIPVVGDQRVDRQVRTEAVADVGQREVE
jgi:ketosteroid isomerase-like protein